MRGARRDIWLVVTALAVLLGGFVLKWIGSGLSLVSVVAIFIGYVVVCVALTFVWMTFDGGKG
jgi:hypothetical protein